MSVQRKQRYAYSTPVIDTPSRQHSPPGARRCHHWLLPVGIGMLLFLAMIVLWNFLVVPIYQHIANQWHYGDAHTFQCDAVVGHTDSPSHPTHFLAFNLHGQIEVIELPGGNPAKAVIYQGPSLVGNDREQYTAVLEVRDINGDGKPDLVIHVVGMGGATILYNNGTTFQAVPPDK